MRTTARPNLVSNTTRRLDQSRTAPPLSENSPPGSSRYSCPRRSRTFIAIAALLSVSLHAGIFFSRIGQNAATNPRTEEKSIALTFTLPQLKDLEEPDTGPKEEFDTKTDLGAPAPMQADLPQIPLPTDFVQAIDFSSLIERPDINLAKIWTVPENIRRGGKPNGGPGNIFNLSDLVLLC